MTYRGEGMTYRGEGMTEREMGMTKKIRRGRKCRGLEKDGFPFPWE